MSVFDMVGHLYGGLFYGFIVSGYLESLLAIIKAITWQDDPGR